jgi:hypothetical protein
MIIANPWDLGRQQRCVKIPHENEIDYYVIWPIEVERVIPGGYSLDKPTRITSAYFKVFSLL